jgi:putative transposase
MRHSRIRGIGLSYYHCLSRIVGREFLLGDEEKEHFVVLMRKLEAFHGVRAVTYCVMSNHFHLLLEIPDPAITASLDRETILHRIGLLYDPFTVDTVRQELARAAAAGDSRWENQILDRYRGRMGNLSTFLQELKQRFSSWYNRRHRRKGTLWEERFKSVLVEGDEKALLTVAAYIDLNPIRARMVDKVEDYRWSGYASAVGGCHWARVGLGRILRNSPGVSGEDFERQWSETGKVYRLWLYDRGEIRERMDADDTGERRGKGGFTQAQVEAEAAKGGGLPLHRVIRLRVRYLSDGVVFGSAAFVEGVFARHRSHFGERRKTGARRMKGADWEDLRVLRDLRIDRTG